MTPQTQELIRNCLVGATLLPLLSSAVLILIGKRWLGRCVSSWGATLAMGASMAMAIIFSAMSGLLPGLPVTSTPPVTFIPSVTFTPESNVPR